MTLLVGVLLVVAVCIADCDGVRSDDTFSIRIVVVVVVVVIVDDDDDGRRGRCRR